MTGEVRLAATLAKIRLSEGEQAAYAKEFEEAFRSLAALERAQAGCEPLVHGVEGAFCALRDDVYNGEFGREALFQCAPDVQGDCFAVPRILE